MSAKLQSIPKETIQVAPKEVVLPTNGVIDFDESLKPPENDDLPSDNSSQDLDLELKEESENIVSEITEQNEVVDLTEVEQSNHEQTDLCNEEEFENQDIVSKSPSASPVQDVTKEPSELDEKSPDPDPPVQDDSFETEAFEANFSDSPVQGPDSPVFNEPKEDFCDDQVEDDFGDFAEVPPLQLDDNDSDFGDFEEESKKDEFASASGWASLDTSPRGKLDQILIGLQLKLSSVISTLFSVLDSSPNEEIFDSVIPMLDLAKEDCQDDSVWLKIHNIQSTPALNQKWKDTLSRQKLLTLLNIDPKNVVSLVNI